nr:unnamed protein product [Spirometra erinaceieuropaei]
MCKGADTQDDGEIATESHVSMEDNPREPSTSLSHSACSIGPSVGSEETSSWQDGKGKRHNGSIEPQTTPVDLLRPSADKAAGNRTNEPLDRQHCVGVQGLSESNAPTPKERISADLNMLQHLLNEMLNSNEKITIRAAFRIGKKTIWERLTNAIQEYLHNEFSPYGSVDIQIVKINGQRVALINFSRSSEARNAFRSKQKARVQDRLLSVEVWDESETYSVDTTPKTTYSSHYPPRDVNEMDLLVDGGGRSRRTTKGNQKGNPIQEQSVDKSHLIWKRMIQKLQERCLLGA